MSSDAKAGRKAPVEYQLLLTATLCLLALGAVMVFSASSATGVLSETGGGGFDYFKKVVDLRRDRARRDALRLDQGGAGRLAR